MKTFSAKPETVRRDWFVVDATDKTLGRLATELAHRLRGKHKPMYTPGMDCGDFVVVVNAEKVQLTGRKLEAKTYYRHSGYPGGLKATSYTELLATEEVTLEHVVARHHVAMAVRDDGPVPPHAEHFAVEREPFGQPVERREADDLGLDRGTGRPKARARRDWPVPPDLTATDAASARARPP